MDRTSCISGFMISMYSVRYAMQFSDSNEQFLMRS
jgi:hypothetical protein